MTVDRIVFQGTVYRRYPDAERLEGRRYYKPGIRDSKKGKELLHREIWKSIHGPIPEGYAIHHADHNPLNNDPENLVCMSNADHYRHHFLGKEVTEKQRQHLAAIRPLTLAWRSSPEGIAVNRENGKEIWAKRQPVDIVCVRCGITFQTKAFRKDVRYCSGACSAAARRAREDDYEDRICLRCGATFRVSKFGPIRCCSNKCAQNYRRQVTEGRQAMKITET